ncbi:MAG: hypothetical protein M3P37_07625 [Actinomycetota bacterium]|nr:hypothetical protein [Actinomycetota bacterium]
MTSRGRVSWDRSGSSVQMSLTCRADRLPAGAVEYMLVGVDDDMFGVLILLPLKEQGLSDGKG